jgi:thiol-disulfide isomerase/thioredoxin
MFQKHVLLLAFIGYLTPLCAQQKINVYFPNQNDSLLVTLNRQYLDNTFKTDSVWLHKNKQKHSFQRNSPDGVHMILAKGGAPVVLFLIDNQALSMTITRDTTAQKVQFLSECESSRFNTYLESIAPFQTQMQALRNQSEMFKQMGLKDKAAFDDLNKVYLEQQDSVNRITKANIQQYPGQLWTKILNINQLPEIPAELKAANTTPPGRKKTFEYVREHFWDNYDFNDSILLNSAAFSSKLNQFLQMHNSSGLLQVEAMDLLFPKLKPHAKYYNTTLAKMLQVFEKPEDFDADRVFVHLADNYYKQVGDGGADIATLERIRFKADAYRKTLNGLDAPDITLPDTSGNLLKLSEHKAKYTLLYFYSPLCDKCKVATPIIHQISMQYLTSDVRVFAVALDDAPEIWKQYARENLVGWTNVHSGDITQPLEKSYAIPSLPCIYLLDANKKILTKRFPLEKLEDILARINK